MVSKKRKIWTSIFLLVLLILIAGIFYFQFKYSKNKSQPGSSPQEVLSSPSENSTQAQSSGNQSTQTIDLKKLFQNALNFYQQKQYANAEAVYKQILNQEPNNLDALLGLGNTYRDWKKYDLAISQYEKVISLDAHKIEAYISLAQVYKNKNQIDKAKEILNTGLKNNPGNADLQNSLDILEIEPSSAEGR